MGRARAPDQHIWKSPFGDRGEEKGNRPKNLQAGKSPWQKKSRTAPSANAGGPKQPGTNTKSGPIGTFTEYVQYTVRHRAKTHVRCLRKPSLCHTMPAEALSVFLLQARTANNHSYGCTSTPPPLPTLPPPCPPAAPPPASHLAGKLRQPNLERPVPPFSSHRV